MRSPVLALVESNTTGTGRLFAAAARARGARPVLISSEPHRYPWAAADAVDVVRADTSDVAALSRACRSAAGVLSSSEYFVEMAARVAARLGLPGPDPHAVARCRDKRVQRAVLRGAGAPIPRFAPARSAAAALDVACDLGYPVVCKPADGTGSRGVRLCSDAAALSTHAAALLGEGRDERGRPTLPWVLVEEHVGGPEVSVETFGDRVVAVTDKHLGPLPTFVEHGHDVPSTLGPDLVADAAETALAAVAALSLGWGPAHTEIRLAPAGPVVIEVNPRLAGGHIPVLVRLATGFDLVEATVGAALGDPDPLGAGCEQSVRPGAASIRFLVAQHAGSVTRVTGQAAATAVAGVVDVALSVAPGDRVGGTGGFLDRVGWVVATGGVPAAARHAADLGISYLEVELAPVPGFGAGSPRFSRPTRSETVGEAVVAP